MKSLDQIEPRRIVNSTNTPGAGTNLFVIGQAGSYYLTGNITGVSGKVGIFVAVDNVTLDLSGFALIAVSGSSHGIVVAPSTKNILVRNGSARDWGSAGIGLGNANNSRIENVRSSDNGTVGLSVGPNGQIDKCVSQGNGGVGILAGDRSLITECMTEDNQGNGISASGKARLRDCIARGGPIGIVAQDGSEITHCEASDNTTQGISVSANCSILDCTVAGSARGITTGRRALVARCNANASTVGHGINVSSGSTVRDCVASDNIGDGIYVADDCVILNNLVELNGAAGIHQFQSDGTRIEGNNAVYNTRGLDVDTPGNLIVRNSARGNSGANYEITAGNKVGPIVAAPDSLNINGSSGGAGIGSTDPWANISF